MPRLRSKEELDLAASHLNYEYQMLQTIVGALSTGTRPAWLTNALLESFVIHLRALIDFFYTPDRPKPDDMLATDYFPEPRHWESVRPSMSEVLKNARARAHKEIAHLTYARLDVTSETKPWNFVGISKEIESLMDKFLMASGRKSS
jgi:hypothetical protein